MLVMRTGLRSTENVLQLLRPTHLGPQVAAAQHSARWGPQRAVPRAAAPHGALRDEQTSCLRASAVLAEGHQPPPELDDDDDDDGVELDLRSEPDGVTAHQRPPEALRSLPLIWPGAVSPEYV